MTEAEWLACDEPGPMLRNGVVPTLTPSSPRSREFNLVCAACARMVWHLLPDGVKSAVEWLEATAGRGYEQEPEAWERHTRNIDDASNGPGSPEGTGPDQMSDQVLGSYIVWAAWRRRVHVAFIHLCRLAPTDPPDDTPRQLANLLRDIFSNPFRPVAFDPRWRSESAVSLARMMYESRDFHVMHILADALQDAGCEDTDILSHCRSPGLHVRGCWVVDLVLSKE